MALEYRMPPMWPPVAEGSGEVVVTVGDGRQVGGREAVEEMAQAVWGMIAKGAMDG